MKKRIRVLLVKNALFSNPEEALIKSQYTTNILKEIPMKTSDVNLHVLFSSIDSEHNFGIFEN